MRIASIYNKKEKLSSSKQYVVYSVREGMFLWIVIFFITVNGQTVRNKPHLGGVLFIDLVSDLVYNKVSKTLPCLWLTKKPLVLLGYGDKKNFFQLSGSCRSVGAFLPLILGKVLGLCLLQYLNLLYLEITVSHPLWTQTLPLLYEVEGLLLGYLLPFM